MANDVDFVVLSSDDDDIPLNQSSIFKAPLSHQKADSAEDPDWVRSYSPPKPPIDAQDSTSDSFINLISDDDGDTATQEAPTAAASSAAKPAKKKARGPTRPRNELPFVAAARVDESLSLLQAEDDELDLSGDVGAVGRVKVDGEGLVLDIKGTLYRATPYVSNSMCVVTVGDEDAKVTAVMNHAIVMRAERNLFASDEGVLDGHVYDDEAEEPLVVDGGEETEGAGTANDGKSGKAPPRRNNTNGTAPPRAPRKSITKGKAKAKASLKEGKGTKK